MSNAVQNINKASTGLCPHGMSPSACPICSGMGGGMRVGERPQKAGEMSYHQCAMIGAMMKARQARIETHEKNLQKHAEAILAFQQNLEKMSQNMLNFANQISKNFIFKPVAYTITNVVVPIVNFAKNIPNIISNITEKFAQLKQKIVDIQDKLNAIFGEAKAFLDKKVAEIVSTIKSKVGILFKILKKDNLKDKNTKIDEDKKIFNLKTLIQKLRKKKKNVTED